MATLKYTSHATPIAVLHEPAIEDLLKHNVQRLLLAKEAGTEVDWEVSIEVGATVDERIKWETVNNEGGMYVTGTLEVDDRAVALRQFRDAGLRGADGIEVLKDAAKNP